MEKSEKVSSTQRVSSRKRPVFTLTEPVAKQPEHRYILTRKKKSMDIPVKKEYTAEEKREFAKKRKLQEHLREIMLEINIENVFLKLDGEPKGKGKFYIPDFGSVIYKGNTWSGVSDTLGKGFGGTEFVKLKFGFKYEMEALTWMVQQFGENIDESLKIDLAAASQKNDFNPPDKVPEFAEIGEQYLTEKRGLPPYLVRKLFDQDKIYVDGQRRCIFLADASAEVRSTHESYLEFKGAVEGSQVDISGFTVMPELNVSERVVSKVEAAVDAISYNAIFPGRFTMSTNGAARYELQYRTSVEAVDNGYQVSLAYDADDAGDLAAQREFNSFYLREKLSKELQVDKEVIDNLLLQGAIRLKIDISAHHLFIRDGWEDEKTVSVKQTRQEADPEHEGKMKTIHYWEESADKKAPELVYSIDRDLMGGKLTRGEHTVVVRKEAVNYIENKIGVKRDRPIGVKDWNEQLVQLGSAYILDVERCAASGFKELPKLPDYLEKMRRTIKPVVLGQPLDNVRQSQEVSQPKEKTEAKTDAAAPRTEEKSPVQESKSDVKNDIKKFTTDLSRQEIFNALFVRLNITTRLGKEFGPEVDEMLKNKRIEFILENSPHMLFCNDPFEDERAVCYTEHGESIATGEYKSPMIRAVFHDGLTDKIKPGATVDFKVKEKSFNYFIRYMDKMSEYLEQSKDWEGALNRMGAGFIVPKQSEGETLMDKLGNGKLERDLEEKKNNKSFTDYDDFGMSEDSYGDMLESYTQLGGAKNNQEAPYKKPQLK